jgi:hypothetical protein
VFYFFQACCEDTLKFLHGIALEFPMQLNKRFERTGRGSTGSDHASWLCGGFARCCRAFACRPFADRSLFRRARSTCSGSVAWKTSAIDLLNGYTIL